MFIGRFYCYSYGRWFFCSRYVFVSSYFYVCSGFIFVLGVGVVFGYIEMLFGRFGFLIYRRFFYNSRSGIFKRGV